VGVFENPWGFPLGARGRPPNSRLAAPPGKPRFFFSALHRWGLRAGIRFPVVKLLDYAEQWETLEGSRNPFAMVVLAHLKHPPDAASSACAVCVERSS